METGGLDARRCALLEVGLLAVREGQPIAKWHTRVVPWAGLDVDVQAAAVNGYSPAWGGAEEGDVLRGVVAFLGWFRASLKRKHLAWIGANVPFDRGFLSAAAERQGVARDLAACFSHRDVDVARIAVVPYLLGELPGIGLDVLRRDLLGRPPRWVHSAIEDCEETLDCLQALVDRLRWVPFAGQEGGDRS